MISVYVKHFLNENGKSYFDKEWFPKVKKRLSAQEGFISIGVKTDAHPDCRYITVRFDNDELLNQWVAEDDHQVFLDALAPYRSQDWYAVKLNNAGDPPQSLDDWQRIPKDN